MPHLKTYSLKDAICGCYHSMSHCGMNQTSPKSLNDCSMMMSYCGCSMTMSLSDSLSLNLTNLSHCDSSTTNCSMMMNYCGCSTMMSLSDS